MKFAICNETFGDRSFADTFSTIAKLGYTGVEIAPFTFAPHDEPFDLRKIPPERFVEVRAMAADAGLEIIGLHWLLATNYLQHAHADGRSAPPAQEASGGTAGIALNYARNFEGLVNPLLFNIGLHTAHHENPHAHWSQLTELHRHRFRDHVDGALNERGLVPYMLRVFVLGAVLPRYRSRSLMVRESSTH